MVEVPGSKGRTCEVGGGCGYTAAHGSSLSPVGHCLPETADQGLENPNVALPTPHHEHPLPARVGAWDVKC